MEAMTPRDRVLSAIRHEQPDRIPFILGVDNSTTIATRAYRRLKHFLTYEAPERYLYNWRELGAAEIDEDILIRLGSDARGVWDRKPRTVEERNLARSPDSPYVDDFGVGQTQTGPEEWFPSLHPIRSTALAALDEYAWPDMDDMTRYEGVRERTAALADQGRYAIFAAPWLLFPFERAMQLVGMDRLMVAMASDPDFAQELFARLTGLFKRHLTHFLAALDGRADVLMLGDDLGMEDRLLISPRMYRRLLKPFHADLIAFIKARTSASIFFHTDGDVFNVLDDLVEIGVDILNPIQTSAGRMADLAELKRRYGQALCFCGAVDTQRILPHGAPRDVIAEVQRVSGILAPGGGYMAASVHTILNDVPPENILALAEAVRMSGYNQH